MNKIGRSGLIAAGLIVFFNILAVVETDAQVLREVLKRMDAHYRALQSLRASVKMDKFNAQLGELDRFEGTIIYIPQKGRDAAFRVDWTKPAKESLSVVNGRYDIYRPGPGVAYTGSVNDVPKGPKPNGALAFLNMSKAQLQSNYTVNYVGQENVSGYIPTWHLQLIPKVVTSYKSSDLWVDGNGMPIQAKVTENNNDTTSVLLFNLQKNVTIKTSDIPIKFPPGLKPTKS